MIPIRSWKLVKFNANGTVEEMMFNQDKYLGERGDFGSSATEYITEPTKEGSRVLGWNAIERQVALEIVVPKVEGQRRLDEIKFEILEFCKPNQYKPVELQIVHSNGKRFRISIRPEDGAPFASGEQSGDSLSTLISMIAHHPYWYSLHSFELPIEEVSISGENVFSFPITFPILFGIGGIPFRTEEIDYQGSVFSRPKITVSGPYEYAYITNLASNISFSLTQPISSSEIRTIEFDEINLRWNILDESSQNQYNELSFNSNLEDFGIVPKNEALSEQIIEISFNGRTDDTSAKIEYFERYSGI